MGRGKKTSLKAALSSQQTRLKKKQEALQAAQLAEQKSKKKPNQTPSSSRGKGKAISRPATIPFSPTDKILLVGEGNFSFTRALVDDPPAVLQYLPPGNITATAYDSEPDCYSKYPDAEQIVQVLREKGVEVLFKIDATKLEKCSALRGRKFDKIVWNFPHAGKGITDQDRNILSNQLLLLGFLRSAARLLATGPIPSISGTRKQKKKDDDESEDAGAGSASDAEMDKAPGTTRGSVLITLRNVPPYTLWDLSKLAKNPPPPEHTNEPPNPRYIQLRSFVFDRSMWKGYEHRMTKGERAHGQGKTGQGGEDRMWQFCLRDD